MTPRMTAITIELALAIIVLYWYIKGIKPVYWMIQYGYCFNKKVESLSIKQKIAGFFTIVSTVVLISIGAAIGLVSFAAWLNTLNSGSWY